MINQNRIFLWIAAATGGLLLIPLIAMQFTEEVNWTFGDFIIMGVLIFGLASLYVLVARHFKKNRLLLAGVFLVVFLYIWAELAVGIFTNLGS